MGHHKKLDRAFVSFWLHRTVIQWVQGWSTTESWIEHLCHIGHTEMKCSGCKVGPPQRAGPSLCINWLHRNEMQWVQGWPTTESWIEHLYNIGYTEMQCSGCKVGPPQRAGSSMCITHWLHRNELQWVRGWSTTQNWLVHVYHIGHADMTCSGCKVGPPQRIVSSICITHWIHRNEIQWVRGWSTTENWIDNLCHKLATPTPNTIGAWGCPPQRFRSSICITIWQHRN